MVEIINYIFIIGLLGISQTSFLPHFSVMGSTLNSIFILYFIVVFFEEPQKYIQGIFSAAAAGFFLDIFSSSYFGASVASLLIVGLALKYTLSLLKKTKDRYPIVYFAPLFILSFVVYNFLSAIAVYFNWVFLVEIIYNLAVALLGFYIYKKFGLYEFSK